MKKSDYFEENLDSRRVSQQMMSLHKKTLEKIKSRKLNLINPLVPGPAKTKKFNKHQNYKNDVIYQENRSLLNRLLSLSQAKLNLTRMKSQESQRFNLKKSMNKAKRSKDAEEILQRNKLFANKLSSISPSFPLNKLKKEYLQHMQYRSNLSRYDSSQRSILKKRSSKGLPMLNVPKNLSDRKIKLPLTTGLNDSFLKKDWKMPMSLLNRIPFA